MNNNQQNFPGHPGRNYLRPSPKPNVIDLNNLMKTSDPNQPRYKESDEFISKKVLMNIKDATSRVDILNDENYKKYAKIVKDVKVEKGIISYLLEGNNAFLTQDVLEMNYILNFRDNIWDFYQQTLSKSKPKNKKKK